MIKWQIISLQQALDAVDIYGRIPIRFTEDEFENSLAIASEHGFFAIDHFRLHTK